ncbi:hypothetical protein ACIA8I_14910 [Streptomyces rishiriensis]|uniref:hypothetical protein n=1 Tax=Streptomyces rishiriensis TaxID=68264 RepID=UPI003794B8C3
MAVFRAAWAGGPWCLKCRRGQGEGVEADESSRDADLQGQRGVTEAAQQLFAVLVLGPEVVQMPLLELGETQVLGVEPVQEVDRGEDRGEDVAEYRLAAIKDLAEGAAGP